MTMTELTQRFAEAARQLLAVAEEIEAVGDTQSIANALPGHHRASLTQWLANREAKGEI